MEALIFAFCVCTISGAACRFIFDAAEFRARAEESFFRRVDIFTGRG